MGSVDSRALVWEAFKITIRGHCRTGQHGILKQFRRELDVLERDIGLLEREYEAHPGARSRVTLLNKISAFAVVSQ